MTSPYAVPAYEDVPFRSPATAGGGEAAGLEVVEKVLTRLDVHVVSCFG
jgi:hypothetical protein